MNLRDVMELMERHLPCPPNPMPAPNTDADYLWRATLHNSQEEPPLQLVRLVPRAVLAFEELPLGVESYDVPITTVECDARGRGFRVVR